MSRAIRFGCEKETEETWQTNPAIDMYPSYRGMRAFVEADMKQSMVSWS
jgi:hypothetical protein